MMLYIMVAIPFALMGLNIVTFLMFLIAKKEKKFFKIIELVAIALGAGYLYMYVAVSEILFVSWDTQLYNRQQHSMISPDAFITILVISLIAGAGYVVVRFIPAQKQSPIVSALGISCIYLGVGVCVVWCIQTISDLVLVMFPANCILLFVKTVYILVYQKNNLIQTKQVSLKYKRVAKILNTATNLPWVALLLVIPLLGIIVAVLFLFGQEPNSVIKAWTETAEWTLSQKTAPQNIYYDEHYLCTVAAGGHRNVVKPTRSGYRHGHRVLVNRQLCIANAFEQVLQEKLPKFHKAVRKVYDNVGYPIARHIRSQYVADAVYFIMKPLEWLFLLVLYTVDINPEDRIATQYPHTEIPNVQLQKGGA